MSVVENETINGWTFEETIKTAENLMETENNIFKWDVLRHLRDFAEHYKEKVQQFEAIGTIEEFKALKEKSVAKKPKSGWKYNWVCFCCGTFHSTNGKYCSECGQAVGFD